MLESTKAPIDRMTAPKRTWPMHWLSAKPVRSTVTDAEIMIVVGRGVGSQRGVHQWQGFAKRIGAHMGATRAVVDADGPFAQQVGQIRGGARSLHWCRGFWFHTASGWHAS